MTLDNHKAVDNYIAQYPVETQKILTDIRTFIQKIVPNTATECINYGIPTFLLNGNLVHYGAYNTHIGFYPGPSGIAAFKKELSVYKGAKGSVQFPIDKPMPLDLIDKIVRYRIAENIAKAAKKNERTCKQGHKYTKSSDCPTCPICEKLRLNTAEHFIPQLSAPAKRALENNNIMNLNMLAEYSEKQLLALHGIGKAAIPMFKNALKKAGLKLKV